MNIRFHTIGKSGVRFDCVIIPTFEDTCATFAGFFAATSLSWLAASPALADHVSKKNHITLCHGPADSSVPRTMLVGLGERGALCPQGLRAAIASAVKQCRSLGFSRLALPVAYCDPIAAALGCDANEVVREVVVSVFLASYSCTAFRSGEARKRGKETQDPAFFAPESLVLAHNAASVPVALRQTVRLAEAEAAGVCLARDLVNAPANIMTPARMAEEAVALARRHGFACRILHKAEMAKLGMEALLAVAEGSHKEARFIVLEHAPGSGKKRDPLVLVGKGISFDTGGISLKPSAGMHHMKGDMAGGAAVLGLFEAIGKCPESVRQPVVGLIPCVENMPGGNASRPGDIVATMSGKTVEILNTDAEGRLILCDALTYAQKNWKPSALVDIATLTGACAVALGNAGGGLFCTNDTLRELLAAEGELNGDRLWPMPLWDCMNENLKSDIADMANVGPREGGAITAALFLRAFVGDAVPWAHLDIAGTGLAAKGSALCPAGGTGFGVRTLYALARKALDVRDSHRATR